MSTAHVTPRAMLRTLLGGVLLIGATTAAAQEATVMAVMDVTGTYSDAVDVTATLLRDVDNQGVEGVNVEFYLRNDAGDLNVDLGVVRSDVSGQATLRVPLVNGCGFLGDVNLTGGTVMTPVDYILEARFAGGDDINNLEHDASSDQATLHLLKEQSEVQIVVGTQAVLGEMLTITAKIVDPDGDAPCDRSAVNGGRPDTVAGHSLAFFLDYTGDQDYSDARENLGRADTSRGGNPDAEATASVTADLTPINNLPGAGVLTNAIQVQLPANDGQYLPATARGRLVLDPAPVDATKSTITTDPVDPQASGDAVIISITLRDRFNNALGLDAATHTVSVTVVGDSLGASVDGAPERDPNTGVYTQLLKPTSRGGDITIRIDVDGAQGSSHTIKFRPLFPIGPCTCVTTLPSLPYGLSFVALAAALLLRRRRGVAS